MFTLGDSGEKMGMQITTLLTLVVFMQILQSSVPVWDTMANTPNIIIFFTVSIGIVTASLILTRYIKTSLNLQVQI